MNQQPLWMDTTPTSASQRSGVDTQVNIQTYFAWIWMSLIYIYKCLNLENYIGYKR